MYKVPTLAVPLLHVTPPSSENSAWSWVAAALVMQSATGASEIYRTIQLWWGIAYRICVMYRNKTGL